MATPAEVAVKKLARLPSNCICANCGTTSKYGFSSVCIKYYTFVCNACKSSHQAVSHRCKSLSMSSWDQGEVLKLKTHGNDHARKVWLATAPNPGSGGRPKEGDDINVFKRFVVAAYENKRFYSEVGSGRGEHQIPAKKAEAPTRLHMSKNKLPVAISKAASPKLLPIHASAPAQTPAPAPAPDFLDFGSFESAPISIQETKPAAQNFGDFSQFQTASAPPATAPTPVSFDPFNNSTPQNNNIAAPMTKKDPFTQSAANPTTKASFDPFNDSHQALATNVMTNSIQTNSLLNNSTMSNMGSLNSGVRPNGNQNNMTNNNSMMINNNMMNNNMMNNNMMNNNNMNNNNMVNNINMVNNNNMVNVNNNTVNNTKMMNNMMQSKIGFNQQQQQQTMMMMTMMQQQQQTQMQQKHQQFSFNGNGMMGMQQNNMNAMSTRVSSNNGIASNIYNASQPMNINVMQPMNNNISNNFSSAPTVKVKEEKDPFSGLGF